MAVLLACLLPACAGPPLDTRDVVLSYEENPSWCNNCPVFAFDIHAPGGVSFRCRRGCAVPGEQRVSITPAEFGALVKAFHDAEFFTEPRLPRRQGVDTTIITLRYADKIRVHETVGMEDRSPQLVDLGQHLRAAVPIEPFLKPSIETYRSLLGRGWDLNVEGEDHENALTAAVSADDFDAVRFLIEHGVRITDEALDFAAMSAGPEMLRVLLAATNAERKGARLGALLIGASGRSPATVRFLLDGGADANAVAGGATTPLIAAIGAGSLETARLLLDAGADVHAGDGQGRTAFWYAAGAYNSGFISMLAARGADPNVRDTSGATPIMHAASLCAEWNIAPLLAAGADPRLADNKSRNALSPQTGDIGDPKCARVQAALEKAVRALDVAGR